jgi:hypothetical protein
MWKAVAAISVTLWFAQIVWADDLRIVGNYDVQWCPSVEPSLDFVLGIENVSSASPTPDLLQAWQMVCKIIPAPGASGVSFGTPSNYVTTFNSVGQSVSEGTRTSSDATGLIAGYLDYPGATVPTTDTEFSKIELMASLDAVGQFYIAIIPDSVADANGSGTPPYFGTAWYSSDYIAVPFDGMPFGGDPVIVGSVVITPEPSDAILLLSGLAVLAVGRLGHRLRTGTLTSSANHGDQ